MMMRETFLVSLKALLIFGISFLALGEERGERQGAFGSRSGSEWQGPSPLSRFSIAFSLGSTTHLPIFRYRNLEGQIVPGENEYSCITLNARQARQVKTAGDSFQSLRLYVSEKQTATLLARCERIEQEARKEEKEKKKIGIDPKKLIRK